MRNKKRVSDFRTFLLNEQNTSEGLGSMLRSKANRLAGWAKDLYQAIADGLMKMINKGPKAGSPRVGYFDPVNGKVTDQIDNFYRGTEFSKMNPVSALEGDSTNEAVTNEDRIPLEYTGEDQTVRNVDTVELRSMIEKLYRAQKRRGPKDKRAKSIFIYGAPGIGKTQIVGQACDSLDVPMLNLDLQFMAPEDFLGIPSTVTLDEPDPDKYKETGDRKYLGKKVTTSNPPAILPTTNGKDDKGGVMFLDEMNRSSKMVLDSTMQFVQMGRLGEYLLPDNWVIVAAGNRPEEATVAEFDFALADRFTIVNLVPKVADWVAWAKEGDKVEDEVINFIERNEEIFHLLDPEKGTLKFPTPRSWVDAATHLKDEVEDEGLKSWKDLSMSKIYDIFADQIGPSAAAQLKAYLEVILKVSEKDLEDMVNDPLKASKLPKTADFASVIFGVSEMAIKKAQELSGKDNPAPQKLYNIMEYFNRYENIEQLTWIYKRIAEKYPDFAVTQEVLDTRDEVDSKAKIDAARLIQKGASDKGLLGEE